MADPPTLPGRGARPDRESTTSTPRWVKVVGVVGLALVLLVVAMVLIGGHGPGRHASGGLGGRTPPTSFTAHGLPQP